MNDRPGSAVPLAMERYCSTKTVVAAVVSFVVDAAVMDDLVERYLTDCLKEVAVGYVAVLVDHYLRLLIVVHLKDGKRTAHLANAERKTAAVYYYEIVF